MIRWFLIVILFSNICFGYCRPTNVAIYFANGMFNSRSDALESYEKLIDNLPGPNSKDYREVTLIFPGLAYNTDEALLLQLYEVLGQKQGDLKLNFWMYLSDLVSAPKEFIDLFRSIQVNLDSFGNVDLGIQIENYKKTLNEPNHHIVTIAHSQGNFFTNLAFSKLGISDEIKQRLDMVSVANPAGYVFDWGSYTTLDSDCVISAIPGALKANVTNAGNGYCDHSLEVYLKGTESRQKIMDDIDFAIHGPSIQDSVPQPVELKRIARWYNHYKKTEKQDALKTHQCFGARVYRSMFNLYWKNKSCDELGYNGVKQVFEDCLDIKNNTVNMKAPNHCPVSFGSENVALNSMIAQAFTENYLFGGKHPECDWDRREFINSVLTEALSEEAFKFIKSPWDEIKPY